MKKSTFWDKIKGRLLNGFGTLLLIIGAIIGITSNQIEIKIIGFILITISIIMILAG